MASCCAARAAFSAASRTPASGWTSLNSSPRAAALPIASTTSFQRWSVASAEAGGSAFSSATKVRARSSEASDVDDTQSR